MKKVRDIFCVLLLLCTTMSCENWLDVDPKTEIKSELMFQSVSGFKDALMGVYLTLRDPELYGKEATWGFVDAIGQQTDIQDQAAAYYMPVVIIIPRLREFQMLFGPRLSTLL